MNKEEQSKSLLSYYSGPYSGTERSKAFVEIETEKGGRMFVCPFSIVAIERDEKTGKGNLIFKGWRTVKTAVPFVELGMLLELAEKKIPEKRKPDDVKPYLGIVRR